VLRIWQVLVEKKKLTQGERKKRQRKKTPTYCDVVLSLIAAVLALAGSGQELMAERLRTERLRTEGVAGVDVHSVVVREQRLNGHGRENREGRKRKDACLAMACGSPRLQVRAPLVEPSAGWLCSSQKGRPLMAVRTE
jgi:hypothetical protein